MIKIPLIDIRKGSPADLLKLHTQKAIELIEASKNTFGFISKFAALIALPIGDKISRNWLQKTQNPYLSEIDEYANILGIKGIYALNMSYEWGCTTGVYANKSNSMLVRVLDWPFPSLGENVVVAIQSGNAGDFYNVTWPGVSGVFQATAPNRFSAALNQAPMRRHKTGVVIDWILNRYIVNKQCGLPPAHLLRKVFETAKNYQEAKEMLTNEPVSIPVIYTLSGLSQEEGCVIERLENRAVVRKINEAKVSAANHFESGFNGIGRGWLPRAIDSYGRSLAANSMQYKDFDDNFNWLKPPIASSVCRVVMQADSSLGKLSVIGMSGVNKVTEVFSLTHKQ